MTAKKAKIVPLEYAPMGTVPAPPSWTSLVPEEARDQAQLLARVEHLQAEKAELSGHLEQRIAAARSEAYEAGKREQEERQGRQAEQAREALAQGVAVFAAGRDRYFADVEQEVVRLALAIAARILHRESQMDPLLLSGAVKVALGQLSESTEVRLHVPAAEAELWTGMLRLMPDLALRPAILPDSQLEAGECRLETHLGSVDLGVRAQLAEIERGFFDLLDQRGKDQSAKEQRVKLPHAATA
jgi:flagellar assembly protein FliH